MHPIWLAAAVMVAGLREAAADDPPPDPGEVIVVEQRAAEAGEVRIPAAQLRELPGALGDPVRAVLAMPGIAPAEANRPDVYIRGAPPGNTALFVDGIRVPLLFHGGVATSVIPAALVEAVELFASVAPVRYGGIAGAVLALDTTAPAERARVEARLTAYEGGGLVETPVVDGRASVLAAARIGYPQTLIGLVASSDLRLSYWDYQARATWRLGEHDRVAALAFGSGDHLAEAQDDGEPMAYVDKLVSQFHRVGLRYEHATPTAKLAASASGGWTRQGAGDVRVRDRSVAIGVDGELALAPTLQARAGVHVDRDDYALRGDTGPAAASPANAAPPPINTIAGGYLDFAWDATSELRITAGTRFDAYHSTRTVAGATGTEPAVEPRVTVRWRARPDVALVAAAGVADQFPLLRVGAAPTTAVSVPGFWADERRLQRARQTSAGVEWLLPEGIVGRATAFASVTRGLTDLARQCQGLLGPGAPPASACGDAPSTGVAYGLELALRRPLTEHLAGWLAYTWSHATERVDGDTVASPFDRTHVFDAAAAYQLSARWRAGARLTAYSGAPFLAPASPDGTPAYQFRLPWFERIDLRAERLWSFDGGRSVALVIDVLNATLAREQSSVICMPTCSVHAGSLFFVPSVGVEGKL